MIRYLEEIVQQKEVESAWKLHCARMDHYGFDRLLYAFTRFHRLAAFGHLDDMLILSNHDPDYLEHYISDGIFEDAPMVKWAAAHEGACSWSWVEERRQSGLLTPREVESIRFNLDHDVRAGYSIAFPDTTTRKGGIGLCARKGISQREVEKIWAEYGREIILQNTVFHLQVSSMPHVKNTLSARQREALEGVANGKTLVEIAELMGLSVPTVEKHLRRAREVLDVETTAQAVLKASVQQQIFNRRPTETT